MAATPRHATLYRMVMPDHVCPYGLKSLDLLKREGYNVDDHWLKTRGQTDEFKAEQQVSTTPQTFISGQRIGGYDDLRRHLGKTVKDPDATSYRPVIAVFVVAMLLALATVWAADGTVSPTPTLERFIALSMCILALLKLQDVDSFSTMFLNYDVLARRYVPYSYFYPFGELTAGVLMVANVMWWLSAPIALFIGSIGAFSVLKAVYIDKRELKCACVGGASSVPLGFISLTENVMMIVMSIWVVVSAVEGLG